jgi:hypothetical protein
MSFAFGLGIALGFSGTILTSVIANWCVNKHAAKTPAAAGQVIELDPEILARPLEWPELDNAALVQLAKSLDRSPFEVLEMLKDQPVKYWLGVSQQLPGRQS